MEFRILGPIEVVDGDRIVSLPRLKQRALLALLLLRPGRMIATDRRPEARWGGRRPLTARNALQNNVSQLRKALGSQVLLTRPPGYLLDVEPARIDLGRFDLLVAQARASHSDRERASLLREALALWRGEPFGDLVDEPFTLVERPGLLDRRLFAQQDLIDTELALGRHATVVGELEALIDAHPYDERLYGQLMLALYRAGRRADALAAFARARDALDELGLEPGPELKERQRAVLTPDPALLAGAAAPAEGEPRRRTDHRAVREPRGHGRARSRAARPARRPRRGRGGGLGRPPRRDGPAPRRRQYDRRLR